MGHTKIVHLLLTAKADPNICDEVCIMYRDGLYSMYLCILFTHVYVYNTTSMYYMNTRCYNNIHVHGHH